MTPPGVFFLAIFQQTANLKQICLYDSAICQQLQNESDYFRILKFLEIFSGTGHFVQCHQNRVVTVTTWPNLSGCGQNVHNHFRSVKDCVYSAFWGFRYVRMYRFCTHVHSKKAKFSHLSDFGCSQSGNRQFC